MSDFSNPEIEVNILQRMILRPEEAAVHAAELQPEDFSDPQYGAIFRAIQTLIDSRKPVDGATIEATLSTQAPGAVQPDTLAEIISSRSIYSPIGWQPIDEHIRIVRDMAKRRRAIAAMDRLMGNLRDPARDIGETLSDIASAADRIETGQTGWTHISDVLLQSFDYIEKRAKHEINSVPTGVAALDNLTGGFFPGEFTVIAARPSVGKSAFGVNIALEAAKQGFRTCFVSCEMSIEGLGQRLLSYGSMVDGLHLRKATVDPEEWSRMGDALTLLSGYDIDFMFDCNIIEDIVSAVQARARRGEIDLLIVDYLQFMETRKVYKDERFRVGHMSHLLKSLAQRANIPVIVLSQVTRQGEGVMPTMKMLRESGDIEQDADGIIFLHRPDSPDDPNVRRNDRDSIEAWREHGFTYIVLSVAKQRNGECGSTAVLFDPAHMNYFAIER